jgi:peptidyl-prolyl cis-trans isomerase B (cyclophilin B)
MNSVASFMLLFSVLVPSKGWYQPNEPLNVTVKPPAGVEVNLVLTDFTNRAIDTKTPIALNAEKTVDIRPLLPEGTTGGTFVLYAVPTANARKDFVGTPLVVELREDKRAGAQAGTIVVRLAPMSYVAMTTDKGPMTMAFYYDVAPNSVENFLALASQGFYEGIGFHRIAPGFAIQGGDPRWMDPVNAGTGGPGYTIDPEFSDRHHDPGVLSMARQVDPNEAGGAMPGCEASHSAGSQFFICLDYTNTQQLDRRYSAFGKIVDGMETVKAIAALPLEDPKTGRPKDIPRILKAEVRAVTARDNPYAKLLEDLLGPPMIQK